MASVWNREKGLDDICKLRTILPQKKLIVMVGVTNKQKKELPRGIIGVERTSNADELSMLYAGADALINPTWGETFGMVNIESLSCGTPVITYKTGGSPESVNEKTGIVIEQGDISGINEALNMVGHLKPIDCRERVITNFNRKKKFQEYLDLYNTFLIQD